MRAPLARERHLLCDAQLTNRAGLPAKPPAMADKFRQHFPLKTRTLPILQQRRQIRRGVHRGHHPFLRSAGRGRLGAEDKPVMRVRAECNQIRRFLNRGEIVLAKDLHQAATGKTGKIDLRRLGKAGEIHHDENSLLLMPPKKGKDLWVFRMQKFERAAREGLEIFPHRDDAAHPPEQRG